MPNAAGCGYCIRTPVPDSPHPTIAAYTPVSADFADPVYLVESGRYMQINGTTLAATIINFGRLVAGPLLRPSHAMAYSLH